MMDGRFTYKIEISQQEHDEFSDRESSLWYYLR
jgi:hypothetical protein